MTNALETRMAALADRLEADAAHSTSGNGLFQAAEEIREELATEQLLTAEVAQGIASVAERFGEVAMPLLMGLSPTAIQMLGSSTWRWGRREPSPNCYEASWGWVHVRPSCRCKG